MVLESPFVPAGAARTHITDGIGDQAVVEVLRAVWDGSPDSQLAHVILLIFDLQRKWKN